MMMSDGNNVIINDLSRGYKVDKQGVVTGLKGLSRKLTVDRCGYKRFSVRDGKKVRPICVHRVVAYLKFGDALFQDGIYVRHLDNNPRNNHWENIAIGTAHQNYMDQSVDIRKRRAKHAASFIRRLTNDEVQKLRNMRSAGEKYKKICRTFGICKSTVSDILNGKLYRETSNAN